MICLSMLFSLGSNHFLCKGCQEEICRQCHMACEKKAFAQTVLRCAISSGYILANQVSFSWTTISSPNASHQRQLPVATSVRP